MNEPLIEDQRAVILSTQTDTHRGREAPNRAVAKLRNMVTRLGRDWLQLMSVGTES